jgi:hypothetical protein
MIKLSEEAVSFHRATFRQMRLVLGAPNRSNGANTGRITFPAKLISDQNFLIWYGPQKMAMMKEMGMANAAVSKGDTRGACKSYMRAQKIGMMKSDGMRGM